MANLSYLSFPTSSDSADSYFIEEKCTYFIEEKCTYYDCNMWLTHQAILKAQCIQKHDFPVSYTYFQTMRLE